MPGCDLQREPAPTARASALRRSARHVIAGVRPGAGSRVAGRAQDRQWQPGQDDQSVGRGVGQADSHTPRPRALCEIRRGIAGRALAGQRRMRGLRQQRRCVHTQRRENLGDAITLCRSSVLNPRSARARSRVIGAFRQFVMNMNLTIDTRARSDPIESDRRSRSLSCRIFFDEPVSTSSEKCSRAPACDHGDGSLVFACTSPERHRSVSGAGKRGRKLRPRWPSPAGHPRRFAIRCARPAGPWSAASLGIQRER